MSQSSKQVLRFLPWHSFIDVGFWFELAQRKLDVIKLSESAIPVYGFHKVCSNIKCPSRFQINAFAFEENFKPPMWHMAITGRLYNTNTLQAFKDMDLRGQLDIWAQNFWAALEAGKNFEELSSFLLITFADLKKYVFYYRFAFPMLYPRTPFAIHAEMSITDAWNPSQLDVLEAACSKIILERACGIFLIKREKHDEVQTASLSDWPTFFVPEKTLVVVAANSYSSAVNWIVQNLLVTIQYRWSPDQVDILQYRVDNTNFHQIESSNILTIRFDRSVSLNKEDFNVMGWERNSDNKVVPKVVNLRPMMDKKKLAEQAAELNLKLMRWRFAPNLDIELIKQTKCLLFGAGTLGCNLARNLIAWGVRNITLIDNGSVSLSNPVRQSLYTFEDSIQSSASKAMVAAKRLKEICPHANIEGVKLSVPMPGHLIDASQKSQVEQDIQLIENMIEDHDFSFLLLDSREARWLPTVISAVKQKPAITAALGFDNLLVIRHGVESEHPNQTGDKTKTLGCYFCNDVVSPQNSSINRALDQQCTTTRPGLSMIASGLTAELFINLIHHPMRACAPADESREIGSEASTDLGIIPHQIRLFLSHFVCLNVSEYRYKNCVACSSQVTRMYSENKFHFLFDVFRTPSILEELTGIARDKAESTLQELSDSVFDPDL